MTSEYKIPRFLHQPHRLVFLDSDEAGVLFLFLVLAVLFGGVFWILFFTVPFVLIRKKRKSPRGYVKHLLYHVGLYDFKGAPSVFEKRFSE